MRIHFEKLLNEYGKNESDALNFYLNRDVKSEETHSVNDTEQCWDTSMAEQCARKSNDNSESRCSTIGDDIEPVENLV